MEKVSLFPVSLPTGNSCYSPYRATGTSLSGIKTLIYIFWISRVVFSIPYETRTAQTRRVIIRGVATTDGSFSVAAELYTRPYFAYIDESGNASKPFLLPQEDTDFYHRFMKSYNIPEFITGKVSSNIRKISKLAKESKGVDVTYHK